MKNANTLSRNFVRNEVRKENRKGIKADTTAGLSAAEVNAIIAQYLIDNPVGGGSLLSFAGQTSGEITAGASGTIFSSPAIAADEYLRVKYLMTANAVESGFTLEVDGVDVISAGRLQDITPATLGATDTDFVISDAPATQTLAQTARIVKPFLCKSFAFKKDTGTTARTIQYSYEIMKEI